MEFTVIKWIVERNIMLVNIYPLGVYTRKHGIRAVLMDYVYMYLRDI